MKYGAKIYILNVFHLRNKNTCYSPALYIDHDCDRAQIEPLIGLSVILDSLQTGLTDGTNMNGWSFALAGDYGRGLQVLMARHEGVWSPKDK